MASRDRDVEADGKGEKVASDGPARLGEDVGIGFDDDAVISKGQVRKPPDNPVIGN